MVELPGRQAVVARLGGHGGFTTQEVGQQEEQEVGGRPSKTLRGSSTKARDPVPTYPSLC